MKNIITRSLACVLSFALVGSVLPAGVNAEEIEIEETDEQWLEDAEEDVAAQSEQISEEEETNEQWLEEQEAVIAQSEQIPEEETDKPAAVFNPTEDNIQASNTIATAIELKLNEHQTVNIENGGDYTWFRFTPNETGYYSFESNGYQTNTYVELFSSGSDAALAEDDNTGDGDNNFCLTHKLESGRTYYYRAHFYSSQKTGSFTVTLYRDSMLTVVPVGKTEFFVTPKSDVKLQVKILCEDKAGMKIEWHRRTTVTSSWSGEIVATNTDTYLADNIDKETHHVWVDVTDRFGNKETVDFFMKPDTGLSAYVDRPIRYTNPGYTQTFRAHVSANDKTDLKMGWFKKVYDNYGGFYLAPIDGANTDTLTTEVLNNSQEYCLIVRDRYYNQVNVFVEVRVKQKGSLFIYDHKPVIGLGESIDLYATDFAAVQTPKRWVSSDPSVAVVNDGKVTGIGIGTTSIFAADPANPTNFDGTNLTVSFTDTADPSAYYFDAVMWAYENGITVGHGGYGKFSPNVSCTREQIVTFLWRCMAQPEPVTSVMFTDVAQDAWYYKPIAWAYQNGITTGLNDGTGRFGIGQPCTREQCVTFMYRLFSLFDKDFTNIRRHKMFTDVAQDKYYFEAISWAYDKEITTGLNNGTGKFGVGQACTRAMIVTFLHRSTKI